MDNVEPGISSRLRLLSHPRLAWRAALFQAVLGLICPDRAGCTAGSRWVIYPPATGANGSFWVKCRWNSDTSGSIFRTRQRHSESVRAAVYDDCPYCKGRGKVKSALTMSVEIQRKLSEILKKRSRDESDFQLRIVVHPTILDRLRTEDERHLIEMEKRYFGKLSFRADPALHAEQFKIVNVATNEELASVGI